MGRQSVVVEAGVVVRLGIVVVRLGRVKALHIPTPVIMYNCMYAHL